MVKKVNNTGERLKKTTKDKIPELPYKLSSYNLEHNNSSIITKGNKLILIENMEKKYYNEGLDAVLAYLGNSDNYEFKDNSNSTINQIVFNKEDLERKIEELRK